ncbi:MAG: hypothetical protein WC737_00485 [Parcubacteria group bacterium]|jgi:hypothetical protein
MPSKPDRQFGQMFLITEVIAPSRLVPNNRNAVRQTFWICDFILANHVMLSTLSLSYASILENKGLVDGKAERIKALIEK